MKLVVSGGGTGGHVYPGLTIAKTLLEPKAPGSKLPTLAAGDVLWIGSQGGMEEELVKGDGLEFVGLAAGGLRGMRPGAAARNALRIASSVARARRALSQFRPDVVLATGGYACVAVVLAAWSMRVPVLIYLPDVVPGMAIRFLSRFSARVAVTSEESFRYFRREQVIATGYPVRAQFFSLDRDRARQALGLDGDLPVLLVFGGSRGARSINRALVAGLGELLQVCQVVHVSGKTDADWVAGVTKGLPDVLQSRYHHYAYLDDLPAAMVAADLAVARAGAATMGEHPAAGLPALLVPYPHSGKHQQANADHLVRNGAARSLDDAELGERLLPAIMSMLGDKELLSTMRQACRALARPDAAELIAEQLRLLAQRPRRSPAG